MRKIKIFKSEAHDPEKDIEDQVNEFIGDEDIEIREFRYFMHWIPDKYPERTSHAKITLVLVYGQ